MSQIRTITASFECDGPGCPSEFSIRRHWHHSDRKNAEISLSELLIWAKKLGWKVEGKKAFCPDCLGAA